MRPPLKFVLYVFYLYVCLHCMHSFLLITGYKVFYPLELELSVVVVSHFGVLGAKPGSSTKVASAFNY